MARFFVLVRYPKRPMPAVVWEGDTEEAVEAAYRATVADPAFAGCWVMMVARSFGHYVVTPEMNGKH